ncbi:hypothetical protein AGABI2DRAFT_217430 [Agaricus bisporus var. bisporus H97]|uniref:hypothetical protein n=1 Tax=Agaricus bisporus var. bisporus (strain H97 / ATCC MYA-4626 / FGSC 10389) TaxID=936046 RepID=UPI00029F77FE|nr:hypothetical protein AGABI2DRAFT_217430 [Agaricus bisporus var. bisporus H97]EKV50621.1 hypothetical protein AGABI2DRAFT_217430 [Agaricus bisporus var. bisporus H97]
MSSLNRALDLDWRTLGAGLFGAVLVAYATCKYVEAKRSPLNSIPTIGYSGVLSSYFTALKWMTHGNELVQEGYDRYPTGIFKIANISSWIVVLTGRQFLDELRKAPDDVLSFRQAMNDVLQTKYTMGKAISEDKYHIETVRSPLTRNINVRFDDIKNEIQESWMTYIPPTDDWVSFPAYETIMHIVARTSNRYFTGLPLCRDPGYISLQENYTTQVVVAAAVIKVFPDILKPLVGNYMTFLPGSVKKATGYLEPIINERLVMIEQGVDWENMPNDLITWLLETAPEHLRTVKDLTLRILTINFAAIHTSTTTFTQALYDLACHPECVDELRQEAESVIAEHGWTKAAMQRMRKVDSFIKESQRMNSNTSLQMHRKVIKDWMLSDGTVIPAGTIISIANGPMNMEETSFPDSDTFKAFRHSEKRDGEGELDSIKYQMVALSLDMIVFGHGRHACPGRFFAVNEIKAIFTYCLLNYDVQLDGGSMDRPRNTLAQTSVMPNMKAKVMFRKRAS